MKIIVMSDSHGDEATVEAIASLTADAFFHCGDSELSFSNPVLSKMHKVRGNCDREAEFPASILVKVGEKTIFVVHGHEHDVKESLLGLYYNAKEKGADIALFGHSHLYGAEMNDGILFVNPGSVLLPRGGKEPTYAVIEWDETVRVTFNNISHNVVDTIEIKN